MDWIWKEDNLMPDKKYACTTHTVWEGNIYDCMIKPKPIQVEVHSMLYKHWEVKHKNKKGLCKINF